ncbi:hypothetical protein D3C73_1286670 [compost metagenome]
MNVGFSCRAMVGSIFRKIFRIRSAATLRWIMNTMDSGRKRISTGTSIKGARAPIQNIERQP